MAEGVLSFNTLLPTMEPGARELADGTVKAGVAVATTEVLLESCKALDTTEFNIELLVSGFTSLLGVVVIVSVFVELPRLI